MPVEYVWTLAVALFVAALAATLKAADAISSLKLAEKEIDRLRKEIDSLKQKENDSISVAKRTVPLDLNHDRFTSMLNSIGKIDNGKS